MRLAVEFAEDSHTTRVMVVDEEGDVIGQLLGVQAVGVEHAVGQRPTTSISLQGVLWEPAR